MQFSKYAKMLQILPNLKGKKVLDIGIGSGYFEEFLESRGIDADIIGIDPSKEMMQGSSKAAIADGNELPFHDSSFDMVICLDAAQFINSDDFIRVLKPSGLVMFSIFFNKQNLEQRRSMLRNKLNNFIILKELIIEEKESEYAVLARKL
jgi:ubiquinone/menaquinone biosynthesis C-methylase UbiE